MRNTWLGLVAVASVLMLSDPGLAASKPSATLKLEGKSVAVGIGVSWGKGTLTYKGKRYPFSVDGLSVIDVGVSSITAAGNVYHLSKLEDFSGQYTAVSTGGTVGGGGGVASMRNASGVLINLRATTRGLKLKAGADGIKITLEK